MESNRDESEKCIKLAKKHIDAGDLDKAVKFIEKAERLFPSQLAKDLLEKIEQEKKNSKTESSEKEGQKARERTPERRSSKPDCHDLQPKYTPEQLEAVRKIRKCKDYYEILGLTKECTEEDLKKAYRKLALKFHPDKNHAPGATEAFKAIGNAFSCLSDPAKRQRYDEFGIEDSSAPRRRQNGYEYDYTRGFESDVSAEELFRMFFGGGPGFASGHARRQASAASHNRSRERSDSPYTLLLQLSPLICMIVLSLLSSFMVGQAQYSLRRDNKYAHERKTSNLGVAYYVRSDFAAAKDANELFSIERQVEEDYVVELQHACYRERHNRENALWRAQMYGNNDLYRQATNMRMPNCDRLRSINGG